MKRVKAAPGRKKIAINAGHLGTKGAIEVSPGKIETRYFSSITAPADDAEDTLDGLERMMLDRQWAHQGGEKFYFGEDVLIGSESRVRLTAHSGKNRYGASHYVRLVDIMTLCLGVQDGDEIDLALFAPPGMYNDVKPQIMAAFSGKNAKRAGYLKGDNGARQWTIRSIRVFPEGLCLAGCITLDNFGKRVKTDLTSGRRAYLDLGGGTADVWDMVNGQINGELLKSATRDRAGIIINILEPVLKQVQKRGRDLATANLHDIDAVMRRGLTVKSYDIEIGRDSCNLKPLFAAAFRAYENYVAQNIIDGVFSGFDGFDGFYIIGGGNYIMGQSISERYPEKMMDFSRYDHLRELAPEDLDVVGATRYMLNEAGDGR